MSAIGKALKIAKEIHFLVEIDFGGLIKRYAYKPIKIGSRVFEEKIIRKFNIETKFDFRTFRYSIGAVNIEIANHDRLQDEETIRPLDGGIGRVYIWCEGLDWDEISTDGLIYKGIFQKKYHDLYRYGFQLREQSETKLLQLPPTTINTDTWPLHRTVGGNGSVAGDPQALILGTFAKGVPLKCVNTTAFIYISSSGYSYTEDADAVAYDKDGGTIAAATFTFSNSGVDGQGNITSYYDFDGDQVAAEPLSCPMQGQRDTSGEITGTVSGLIEHPAHIIHYLMQYHSTFESTEIRIEDIKTMASRLPGWKFASLVGSTIEGIDMVDRILNQAQCARIPRGEGIGIMTFSTSQPTTGSIKRADIIGETVRFTKTDYAHVINNLKIFYAYNPSQSKYEAELEVSQTNNTDCKKSYDDYGERPKIEMNLPDVQNKSTASAVANRIISLKAFRHDVAEIAVPYSTGYDLIEGDAALLTLPEAPGGWTDEKCILLERSLNANSITQKWWRVAA